MSTAEQQIPASVPAATQEQSEWDLRVELAAVYRLVAHFRMTDLIFSHISQRLPGEEPRFLINPYGLLFEEITASNLVEVGLDGELFTPSEYRVNPAGSSFTVPSTPPGPMRTACFTPTPATVVRWQRRRTAFSPSTRRRWSSTTGSRTTTTRVSH